MIKLARPFVVCDEALLDRLFQPVLNRLAWVRDARYRLAAAPIDLCAGACLASVAVAVAHASDPLGVAVQHGIAVAMLLLGWPRAAPWSHVPAGGTGSRRAWALLIRLRSS